MTDPGEGAAIQPQAGARAAAHDLPAYSRLGRKGEPVGPVDRHAALVQALVNLRPALEESHALVTNGDLPTVTADDFTVPENEGVTV